MTTFPVEQFTNKPFETILSEKIPQKYLDVLKQNNYEVSVTTNSEEQSTLALNKDNFAGTGMFSIAFSNDGLLYKIFFPKDSDLNYAESISNEISLQRQITDPNIASAEGLTMISIGSLRVPCIIREDIPISLSEKLAKEPISVEEGLKLVRDISSACQHVYNETGELITDLTVENIRQRENGSWVICDLGGTAKEGSSKPVSVDAIFTAPEVTEDNPNNTATIKSLTYSLALVLWSSLTGKKINRYDLAFSEISDLVTQDSIPNNIFRLIQKGTSEDPNIRSQSPLAFYKELQQCVSSTKTGSTS